MSSSHKWTSSAKLHTVDLKSVGVSASSLHRRTEPKAPERSGLSSGLNRHNEGYVGSGVNKPVSSGGGYLQDIGKIVHNQHMNKFKERYNSQAGISGPQLSGIPVYIDRNIKTQSSQRMSRDRIGSTGAPNLQIFPKESGQAQKPLQVELSSKIVAASKPSVQLLTSMKKTENGATGQNSGSGQHFSWLWKERHPQASNIIQAKALKSVDNIMTDYYLNHPDSAPAVGASKAKLDALVKNVQPEGQATNLKTSASIPIKARKGEVEEFPTKEYASRVKDTDPYPRHVILSGRKSPAETRYGEINTSAKRLNPTGPLRSSTPGLTTPAHDIRKRSSYYESMNQGFLNSSDRYLTAVALGEHPQASAGRFQRIHTLGAADARAKLLGCIDRVGEDPNEKRRDACEIMNLLREFNFNEGLVLIAVEALVSSKIQRNSGKPRETADKAGGDIGKNKLEFSQRYLLGTSPATALKNVSKNLHLQIGAAADSPGKKFPMFSAPSSPNSPPALADKMKLKDISKIPDVSSEKLEQSSEFSLPVNLPLENLNKIRRNDGDTSRLPDFTERDSVVPSRIKADGNYVVDRITESEHQLADVWANHNMMDFDRRKSNPRPTTRGPKINEDEKLRTFQSEPKIAFPIKKMAKSFVENPLDEDDNISGTKH